LLSLSPFLSSSFPRFTPLTVTMFHPAQVAACYRLSVFTASMKMSPPLPDG
jgi:hypothetical protein